MRVCIFTEPHRGATYDQLLRAALHAEAAGYEGFFRADHYLPMHASDGFPGPTDSWVTLGAMARETTTIRLGTLLTCATFRHPAVTAISVAQVDQMSGGRIDFGLGAGWFGREHSAYGIEFGTPRERFDVLEEQLEVITGLWSTPVGERFSHQGRLYRLDEAPALPKPVQQPGPPVILGGRGKRRTPELAARFADEFNLPFTRLDQSEVLYDRVREACEKQGRTRPLTLSIGMAVACGRTEAEARNRLSTMHEASALPDEPTITGTPAQVVEQIEQYAAIGATRIYIRMRDLDDLDHLDLLAAEVLPRLT
ncbi:F420-dependent oxidoreductase-like protein [Actinoplanes lutulentus]|uniref:F420-dependent oxidoreductase-like protein n=1 Tax=Actinoplanes lutulentus TaxID=1287878 RepID=A0A327Z6K1_9ACTN|nr:LLM class F420-dependent oxidoreductase [Actinoplanes lutulentus]MBB2946255.1 F420-dependent oxidoreductase-like protein [Actinoplanes lutulentus]RAK32942.1 F420-dependent oxidoreductase-like protein [Actinoplanes lutulentus]